MVSTFTPNIQLEEPARGDDVGTWDTPVNSNMTLVDLVAGGITTISLNNSNVVLSAAQFRSKTITFNSTLTGSVTIQFPSSFTKSYEIQNLCTGSSAFTVTLSAPSSLSGTFVSCPPGEIIDITNDGTNIKFKNFGRVGSYWDFAGSSVPNWVSFCGTNNVGFSPLPYLNCDGSAFSSAAYPALTVFLGGTTLPDARGRFRLALNQGTGRVTTGNGGMDGNTFLAGGGAPNQSLITANMPPYTPSGSITGVAAIQQDIYNGTSFGPGAAGFFLCTGPSGTHNFGVSPQNSPVTGTLSGGTPQGGTSQSFLIVNPAYTGGITMIRAG